MSISIYKRPFQYNWAGNPAVYQLYSSVGFTDPATTKIEVKLFYRWVDEPGWNEVTTLTYYTNKGIANINLAPLLDSVMQYEMPTFDVNGRKSLYCKKQSCQFYIDYREITEADPDPAWEHGEYRYALKGGVDFMRWRGNNFFGTYMAADPQPLLTWMPRERMAAYNERMYILHLHKSDDLVSTYNVKMTCYFNDGTDNSDTEPLSSIVLPEGSLFFIPVGAAQWDIDTFAAGEPWYKWSIQVVDAGGDPVSEVFTFLKDNRQDYNQVNLQYRNSLGGIDSIMARGVIETGVEGNYDITEKVTEHDYYTSHAIMAQRIISNPGENAIYKGDVGWVPKDHQERLRDMHVRRELYLYFDGKWWPLLDVTENYKLRSSDDQLFSMPVIWKNAAPPQPYYTPGDVDLGNSANETGLCYAGIIELNIDVDTTGLTAEIEVSLNVDDIMSVGVDKIEYRIPGVVDVWTTVLLSAVPFTVTGIPKDARYQFLVRPVCPDDIPGTTTIGGFNTIGDGSGTGNDSSFTNNSGTDLILDTLEVNGTQIVVNQAIANGATYTFPMADFSDATVFFSVSFADAIAGASAHSDGVNYNSWALSDSSGQHTAVDIIGGLHITIT
jgi:hypothetical protein